MTKLNCAKLGSRNMETRKKQGQRDGEDGEDQTKTERNLGTKYCGESD